MAFWGVEIKSGKPYTHQFDDTRGRLHISHATLGIGKSTKKTLVQCNVGNKSPIFICSLLPDKTESCQLDLEFEEEDDVVFSVIGPHSVHLCGFYLDNGRESGGYEYQDDSDSYGEDIAETESEESTDYETEDDFIDDSDLEAFPSSPVPNSGVVIEEILDDEKLPKENGNHKNHRKVPPSDPDDSGNSYHQIVVRGSAGAPVFESEDEDGFPITSSFKSNPTVQNNEGKAKEKREKKIATKEGKKNTKKDSDQVAGLKRKINIVQDGDPEGGDADQQYDSSVPSTKVVESKKKNKKRVKKEKNIEAGNGDQISVSKEDAAQAGEAKSSKVYQDLASKNELEQKSADDKSLDLDVDHAAITGEHSEEKKKKKKNKKKNKTQEGDENAKVSEVKNEGGGDMNVKATLVKTQESDMDGKASKVRTFPNGLVIEEMAMGKPDGKRASPGKKVSVHYIGKLKKNGNIFDSNIGRAPFKFRLGVGEVIKGWDVGVNGMRVGDKRRLMIPPSMGYGSQGAGGKIPPNSWLVFDVELVNVN